MITTTFSRTDVCDVSDIAALEKDYEHLQGITGNTLPFALFEWHLAWCRHFLNIQSTVEDQPLFQVLRDTSGQCVAIVPLIVSRRRVGPFKVVSVGFLGADPAITEIRGALIAPGLEQAAARAVRSSLEEISDWDWIQWMGSNDSLAASIPSAVARQRAPLQSFVLDLPSTWEVFRAGLKRNIRESLRHGYNSLKREGHDFEFQVITSVSDVEGALDRFLVLHNLRATMENTSVHPNRFASEVSRHFLYDACSMLARRGVLRLFQLKIRGEIVAMRIGFVVADSLYLYYSGFDPAWARYGVMTTTVAEAIKYAIALGLRTINLSPGMDVSKTRWGPRVVEYPVVYERNRGLGSWMAFEVYMAARYGDGFPSRFLNRLSAARRRWD